MVAGVALHTSPKLSALVIDDEPDLLEYFQCLLSDEGFEVTTLSDPTAVIEHVRDEVFCLIVLDEMMPKLSGLDLLPQIRAVNDDIAVIIVTGAPSFETVAASIPYGISGYLGHPITPDTFRGVIARIAKKKRFPPRR